MPDIKPVPDANVRAQSYLVARTSARCWQCALPTHLLALAMQRSHETLHGDTQTGAGDGGESVSDEWQRANVNAFLFYVECLPTGVENRLQQLGRFFRLAHSAATLNSYWANHCEHCGILIGDHELHCEPEGAFMPSSEVAAANIQLVQIPEPFEAVAAGYAIEPEFFTFMRRG